MADAVAAVVAGVGFVGLLASGELVARWSPAGAEVPRKFVHLTAAVAAAMLPLFMSFTAVRWLSLAFVPVSMLVRGLGWFPALHSVERATFGEIYFPLGVFLVALAFPRQAPYAYGVLVMGISDALASVVGQRFGRRRYQIFAATKSYVGSATFFVTTVVITVVALIVVGDDPAAAAALVAIAGVAVLTGAEALLGGGLDNVVLPVLGGAVLAMALGV